MLIERGDKPLLIVMVGIAGSGKSTIADNLLIKRGEEEIKPIVLSSDKIRQQMKLNDENNAHNALLFEFIKSRAKDSISECKDVIVDATNLNKKRRAAMIAEFKKLNCEKICICVMTPFDECVKRNNERTNHVNVPYDKIKTMYMNWQPPHLHEGFDKIIMHFSESTKEFNIYETFERLSKIDQENQHHEHTIGDHCFAAASYQKAKGDTDKNLIIATLMHDIGKEFTKTNINGKGELDINSHYYNHHCVGAYDSMMYLNNLKMKQDDILEIANMIYFHMHPYMSWRDSQRSRRRVESMIGQDMLNKIYKLNEADRAAHKRLPKENIHAFLEREEGDKLERK